MKNNQERPSCFCCCCFYSTNPLFVNSIKSDSYHQKVPNDGDLYIDSLNSIITFLSLCHLTFHESGI